jgi:Tol biopolymer transport system component
VDGYKQIFVRTMASGQERQISSEPRDHIQPAWSSDERRLAFAGAKAPGGKLQPNDLDGWFHEGGEIREIELAGGPESLLVHDAFSPSWSPDGSTLAFDAEWAGPRRIWIADARGRNPRQVTADSSDAAAHVQPRWSPDGSRLAFRRVEKTTSDVAFVDLATQTMTRVTADDVMDTDPSWSPDGGQIYFSSYRGGGINIWRIPVDDAGAAGAPEQLTNGAGADVQPGVSAGADRLVFAVRGINADIWRLPVSPTTGRPVGPPEPVVVTTRVESRGAWSPDGSRLAFNSDRLGEMSIWVRTLPDGSDRRVTSGAGGDYQPAWSPDGRWIVFFSSRGGNTDVWRVEVASGAVTRLTEDPGLDTNPFYSPDGQWIAFVSDRSGRSELWVMRADGSQERQLASVGAWGHFLHWTADSRAIVLRAEGATVRILQVSLTDGSVTQLPDVASGAHMSFSPDASVILDVRGHRTLFAHPVSGRAPYRVFEFEDPDVRIDYPVWSPDGRWVVFDRSAPLGGDLWTLERVR